MNENRDEPIVIDDDQPAVLERWNNHSETVLGGSWAGTVLGGGWANHSETVLDRGWSNHNETVL